MSTEDARQRIVVDAVAFGQIFRFHHLLSVVTRAMQVPRLLVALVMVLALSMGGRGWDGLFESTPTFSPGGVFEADRAAAEKMDIRAALAALVADSGYASSSQITEEARDNATPQRVREWITTDFTDELERLEETQAIGDLETRKAAFRKNLDDLDAWMARPVFQATTEAVAGSFKRIIEGVFSFNPQAVFEGFRALLVEMPVTLWGANRPFCIFYGFFALLVISICGGALCRMAACEYAGRERLRAVDAFMFSTRSWVKLVGAPLLPLVIAAVLAIVLTIAGAGLFNGISYLEVLTRFAGGALYGVGLLIGLLLAFVLLIYAVAFPMVLPAVAVENCGPADAMQRAFHYLISRPLHMLGYAVTALFGMAIGYIVVALFTITLLNATSTFAQGFWSSEVPAVAMTGGYSLFDLSPPQVNVGSSWFDSFSAGLVMFWESIVVMMVVAYVLSYVFSSSTVLYLLMRKTVDDQDPSEIWREGLVPGTLVPIPRRPEPALAAPLAGSNDTSSPPAEDSSSQTGE